MEHISMNAWVSIGMATVSAIVLTIVLIKEHYERKRERARRTTVVPAKFETSDEDRSRCTDMVLELFDILMRGSKDKVFRLGKYQLTEIVEEPANGTEEE